MNKLLLKDAFGWGIALWFIGYVLGFVLFAIVPASMIGWVIMPIGVIITLWVLLKKVKGNSFLHYFLVAIVWTIIAVAMDYLLIVKVLHPVDGYYKLDVYIYYALTFILPLLTISIKKRHGEEQIAVVGELTDNPNVKVAMTRLGRGLVTIADISKGEIIARFDGEIFSAGMASELPNDQPLYVRDHAVQFSDKQYRWSKFGTAMNHSCDPNCGINGTGSMFTIVSMRPISKGTELTFDYEMTEDSDWRMDCKCGSPICRQTIGAYANTPNETRKKYGGYVAKYLIDKYGEAK